ncbi:cytochrome P450 [Parasediminibacterium sp. JCM 36343]|uniref:cytochrome P450 n=1 Tax=Parasediminibacterium sp. JCM 36343 TaxID=3374279 RepID=UPI00397D0FC2
MKKKTIPLIPPHKIPVYAIGLLRNPLKAISKMIGLYGDIFAMQLAKNSNIIFVNHPDFVKHILKDNQDNYSRGKAVKQSAITGLHELLGNGIFMSDGEDWEAQHKLLKGLFSVTAIEATLPTIENELIGLIKKWENEIKTNPIVNIEHELNLLMLCIMLRTQVSAELSFDYDAMYDALSGRMESSSVKALFMFQLKAFLLKPLGIKYQYTKHKKYLETLNAIADTLVEGLVEGKYKPTGLFQLLLADYQLQNTTKEGIRDQFMNFLFAGFDTTATAITWTLYSLAANPALQQQVKDDLANSIKKDATLHLANRQLPLLQMVMKEALRLYPPVWSYAREAATDDVMCGYPVPAKSIMVISSYALHRHRQFWPSGDVFTIENFEKENFKGKNFAYIPFGQGKRMCIGRALADYQMQVIIGGILQAFTLETLSAKYPGITANIIIKGEKPISVRISK